MRRDKIALTLKNIFILIFVLFFAIGFLACAEKKKPAARKKVPTKPPSQVEQKVPEQKPAKPRIGQGESQTPARRASNALIENGNAYISAGEFEKASVTFRDAIKVDASNGPAYYYLGFSYYKMQELELANGSLEKAENLLRHDPEWLQKINEFKANLESSF